jgi:hypothetical protein
MHRVLAALPFVALTALAAPGAASAPQRPGLSGRQGAASVFWSVGERLEYRVKFGFFTVGSGAMQVLGIDTVRGEPCYHVLFTIHGHALMYTLDDSLQSWFGVHDLASRRFAQHTRENDHERSRSYEIYPDRRMWVRDNGDSAETVAEPLDDASFFFFARTVPYELDQTYTIPRYFVADRNPVLMRVLGRQSIGVPAGRFDTWVVRPIFRSHGMFAEGGEAAIWFSTDSTRIPVRIRTSLPIGTLDISLKNRS